jgi:hypothetical protein
VLLVASTPRKSSAESVEAVPSPMGVALVSFQVSPNRNEIPLEVTAGKPRSVAYKPTLLYADLQTLPVHTQR